MGLRLFAFYHVQLPAVQPTLSLLKCPVLSIGKIFLFQLLCCFPLFSTFTFNFRLSHPQLSSLIRYRRRFMINRHGLNSTSELSDSSKKFPSVIFSQIFMFLCTRTVSLTWQQKRYMIKNVSVKILTPPTL